MLTISTMVRTPRPSSPTSQPVAPSYSISDEALDLLPSLSLRRMKRIALRSPPGSTRGTRKQDSAARRLRERQEHVATSAPR